MKTVVNDRNAFFVVVVDDLQLFSLCSVCDHCNNAHGDKHRQVSFASNFVVKLDEEITNNGKNEEVRRDFHYFNIINISALFAFCLVTQQDDHGNLQRKIMWW